MGCSGNSTAAVAVVPGAKFGEGVVSNCSATRAQLNYLCQYRLFQGQRRHHNTSTSVEVAAELDNVNS